MAKNLKLKIKNTQLAEAVGGFKAKLAGQKPEAKVEKAKESSDAKAAAEAKKKGTVPPTEEPRRIRAKSKSDFAPEEFDEEAASRSTDTEDETHEFIEEENEEIVVEESEPISEEITDVDQEIEESMQEEAIITPIAPSEATVEEKVIEEIPESPKEIVEKKMLKEPAIVQPVVEPIKKVKLGPTGRHINDLLPPPRKPKEIIKPPVEKKADLSKEKPAQEAPKVIKKDVRGAVVPTTTEEEEARKGQKAKEFKDLKPRRGGSGPGVRSFDARDRQGLTDSDDERWRKRRPNKQKIHQEEVTIRPTELKIRLPISVKDLASEMKLKASQVITKLFAQGMVVTLNDMLDDDTIVQLIGQEFGCAIQVDRSEAARIRVTDKTIREEISAAADESLQIRAPVVAFMGHVDHGKTSLIDAIRKSNRVAGEAGAITQHIGAFRCTTPVGDITILDTPGHEAFSAMRARGAVVTDIIVLVVAGDEGIRMQTIEAINQARAANVPIVVAINKADKPNFNPENVYRELSEHQLLPEAWGGQTITVNCSAVTKQGISTLLEMLALQAEVLELKANVNSRARGTVLESEMHKGLGAVATVLVQNGTLRCGDALVFDRFWGRVKTMRNEFNEDVQEAGPSYPVLITGLSGLPGAGEEFIAVKNEKEAREIADVRSSDLRQNILQMKKLSVENLMQQASSKIEKKVLNLIVRSDVQGSVEALKHSLMKIFSNKVRVEVLFTGVGEITESDVQLASASKAVILGFHTQVESHAESLIKELGVNIRLHNIIYHAIDDVRDLMKGMLDKIEEEKEIGKAEVKTTFKASHLGVIAGCQVIEGSIFRNNRIRVEREGKIVWRGSISSLKRVKEDVREVKKGIECGILLDGFNDVKTGDILQAYEIIYITQEL